MIIGIIIRNSNKIHKSEYDFKKNHLENKKGVTE